MYNIDSTHTCALHKFGSSQICGAKKHCELSSYLEQATPSFYEQDKVTSFVFHMQDGYAYDDIAVPS